MTLNTRKVALKMEATAQDSGTLLRIETGGNETGMLFRISAVFYVYKWHILSATIKTPEDLIIDEFLVRHEQADRALTQEDVKVLSKDLELLLGGLSVLEYLSMKEAVVPRIEKKRGATGVEIVQDAHGPVIRLRGVDRPGLMLSLSQTFFLTDIDILNASILTGEGGEVINSFEVNPSDARFINQEFRRRLCDELRQLL